jgi:hypothetical protein
MSNKHLKIPAPSCYNEEYEYFPLVRVGRIIPFGYEQDPDDPDILLPIVEDLELLEQAKEHLKQYSLRDVSAWLSENASRSISHMGLKNRIEIEQRKYREGIIQRQLIEQLKKAIHKAEKIEKSYLGKRRKISSESQDA